MEGKPTSKGEIMSWKDVTKSIAVIAGTVFTGYIVSLASYRTGKEDADNEWKERIDNYNLMKKDEAK